MLHVTFIATVEQPALSSSRSAYISRTNTYAFVTGLNQKRCKIRELTVNDLKRQT